MEHEVEVARAFDGRQSSAIPDMSDDWSRQEVEIIVEDYFAMLDLEMRGHDFNKAERNRELQRLLPARSRGSIEFKHQNISAVMLEMGLPYVEGYKRRSNFQHLLREVIEIRLRAKPALLGLIDAKVTQEATKPGGIADILAIQVEPPVREKKHEALYEDRERKPVAGFRDYLELEARNRSLGRAGEELVLEFEHQRLWRAGRKLLAGKIDHVSRTKGDGSGFDILSFEEDGRERLVEVKTTQFGAQTPFFASINEVEVSDERRAQYHVYRLFNFRRGPRLFVLCGSIRSTCGLETVQFRATPGLP